MAGTSLMIHRGERTLPTSTQRHVWAPSGIAPVLSQTTQPTHLLSSSLYALFTTQRFEVWCR
jgi:hypothetical protein|eukprot:COSAG01_NODE_2674_length_7266_cov_2.519325_4_plen_62_part_00